MRSSSEFNKFLHFGLKTFIIQMKKEKRCKKINKSKFSLNFSQNIQDLDSNQETNNTFK